MDKGPYSDVEYFVNPEHDFTEAQQIPLPHQIPTQLNPSRSDKGRSGALDSIILQNEDLMSRLAVQIRRNAILEDELEEQSQEHENQQNLTENMRDQLLILKKKDQFITSRNDNKEAELKALFEKINFSEVKYSEYYTTTQEQIGDLKKERAQLLHIKKISQKYRGKIKTIAQKLKLNLNNKGVLCDNLELERQLLQEQLGLASHRIQTLNKESETRIQNLTQQYSEKATAAMKQAKVLKSENFDLQDKIQMLSCAFDENVELKNKVIQLDRAFVEIKSKKSKELSSIQASLGTYRSDLKAKVIENNTLTTSLKETSEELLEYKSEGKRLKDQVENLQMLWRENQKDNEKLLDQNKSLQSLNQELSARLNEQRSEIRKLKGELDKSLIESKVQITRIKENQRLITLSSNQKNEQEALKFSNEALNKIETLICEIQSGFDSSKCE